MTAADDTTRLSHLVGKTITEVTYSEQDGSIEFILSDGTRVELLGYGHHGYDCLALSIEPGSETQHRFVLDGSLGAIVSVRLVTDQEAA